MIQQIKSTLRDLLPRSGQVPIKYWYSQLTGGVEPEMALLPLLAARGERVIDVGGNRGLYVYRLAKLAAHVEVFEPNPSCYRPLAAWAERQPTVSVYAVALSAEEGHADLLIPLGAGGVEHDSSGSLEHGSTDGVTRAVRVPLRTLDSYAFKEVTLIKVDVEGHEASVLTGAVRTIQDHRPALLVEIEQRHLSRPISTVFDQITGMGYDGWYLKNAMLRPLKEFDVSVDQDVQRLGTTGSYYNNFLFLERSQVAAGRYARLPIAGR